MLLGLPVLLAHVPRLVLAPRLAHVLVLALGPELGPVLGLALGLAPLVLELVLARLEQLEQLEHALPPYWQLQLAAAVGEQPSLAFGWAVAYSSCHINAQQFRIGS